MGRRPRSSSAPSGHCPAAEVRGRVPSAACVRRGRPRMRERRHIAIGNVRRRRCRRQLLPPASSRRRRKIPVVAGHLSVAIRNDVLDLRRREDGRPIGATSKALRDGSSSAIVAGLAQVDHARRSCAAESRAPTPASGGPTLPAKNHRVGHRVAQHAIRRIRAAEAPFRAARPPGASARRSRHRPRGTRAVDGPDRRRSPRPASVAEQQRTCAPASKPARIPRRIPHRTRCASRVMPWRSPIF